MKRLLSLLVFAALAASCSVAYQPRDRAVETRYLNFKPYTSAGFYVSPDPCPADYTPMGQICIQVFPADIKREFRNESSVSGLSNDGIYKSKPGALLYYTKESISADELLQMIVEKALDLGASGLVNLKYDVVYDTHISKDGYSSRTLSYYEISGLCVEKK
ncbi:MAG: hypothetical protein IJL93_07895 [Bacteroidales bacterium]|nr:hypothetical protein [Bacteroidales bacterium]